MDKQVKVLIVDDSATVRQYLVDIVKEDVRFSVVGEARNGEEAIKLTRLLNPDVVSMDVHMPVMNGLECVKEIMRLHPTPIVVVSGSLHNSELNIAFNAIRSGALAVIGKPPAPAHPDFEHARFEFLNTLYTMSEVLVIHRWGDKSPKKAELPPLTLERSHVPIEIVGIASSTGGPSALVDILSQIPGDFRVPIVIVQHISDSFEAGLVQWLNRSTTLNVMLAEDRQPLLPGQVLIAPAGAHLRVTGSGRVALDKQRNGHLNMPSADVMLHSIAQTYGELSLGVILTGMGADGAQGIKAIRDAGGRTIAQDEASCVVFGMPKEAIALGGAEYIASLDKIARIITGLTS